MLHYVAYFIYICILLTFTSASTADVAQKSYVDLIQNLESLNTHDQPDHDVLIQSFQSDPLNRYIYHLYQQFTNMKQSNISVQHCNIGTKNTTKTIIATNASFCNLVVHGYSNPQTVTIAKASKSLKLDGWIIIAMNQEYIVPIDYLNTGYDFQTLDWQACGARFNLEHVEDTSRVYISHVASYACPVGIHGRTFVSIIQSIAELLQRDSITLLDTNSASFITCLQYNQTYYETLGFDCTHKCHDAMTLWQEFPKFRVNNVNEFNHMFVQQKLHDTSKLRPILGSHNVIQIFRQIMKHILLYHQDVDAIDWHDIDTIDWQDIVQQVLGIKFVRQRTSNLSSSLLFYQPPTFPQDNCVKLIF